MARDPSKTEKPTSRRLKKAQKEGRVVQSQEMLSAATLIALIGSVALLGPWFVKWAKKQIISGMSCDTSVCENSQVFVAFVNDRIVDVMFVMSPFLLAIIMAGAIGSILVSGPHFTPKALAWKVESLNPLKGAQRFLSFDSVIKLLFSVAKLVLIGVIVFFYLRSKIPLLTLLQWTEPDQLMGSIGGLVLGVVLRIVLALLVIGLIDWFYRKWKYIEDLKMTKQEVKDEHRNMEGAPEVKNKIRQKQFQAALRRMLQDVPKANVVLVNPTHVAVALQYNPNMAAPVVVAKGGDHMCEKIKEVARAHGVPIIRRPALARELHAAVKIGHAIPEKLFTAVAEVLALLYRIRRRG